MRRFQPLAIAAGLLLAGSRDVGAQAPDTMGLRPAFRRIDEFARQSLQTNGTPGISLALVDRRGLLTARVYGYADLDRRRPVQRDTRFEIGSISKSFTAIALMQLADSGRFDPSVPLRRYLPWFTPASRFAPITGHHLLTHTAGLPSDRDDIPSSRAQAYLARERTLGSAPGSYWSYSNIGYQVLGVLLEQLTGKRYADVIQQRILTPLGMRRAAAQFTSADREHLAVGYQSLYDDRPRRDGDPLVVAPWLEYASGDGAIIASATELGAYLTMLLNHGMAAGRPIMSEAAYRRVMTPAAAIGDGGAHYGYGFVIEKRKGRAVFNHSGGMMGYSSYLLGDPAQGIGAIAFVNGPGDPGEIAEFALLTLGAALRGEPLPELPGPEDHYRVAHATSYAGRYTSPTGASLQFEAHGDSLLLVGDKGRTLLKATGDRAFLGPQGTFDLFPLSFEGDSTGMAEVSYGGDWYTSERYHGPRTFTAPAEWRSYVGHYRIMQPWEPNFRVILRKGKLYTVSPDGDEDPLTPLGPREFRIGDPRSAERLVFGNIVDGEALTATWSGMPYYRYFTP